jgi:hypothetical protein
MKRLHWLFALFVIGIFAGCNTDIVCTKRLKILDRKCVYLAPLDSENPNIGKVLRDVIEKEFVRGDIEICDPNTATIFITGATFLTARSKSSQTFISGSFTSSQAIESVSLIAKDKTGEILMSASYDNKNRYSASKLGKEFGSELAKRLK